MLDVGLNVATNSGGFQPFTTTVTNASTLLVPGASEAVLLVNQDVTNTIYIGGDIGFNLATNAIGTIPPLGSLALDSTDGEIYGECLPGLTAVCQVIPQGLNFQPSPVLVAEQLLTQGLVIVDNPVTLANYTNLSPFSLGNGGPFLLFPGGPVLVNKFQSWGLFFQNTGATPTTPYVGITLEWFNDAVSTVPMHTEYWVVSSNTTVFTYEYGHGPMHGPYMNISFYNYQLTGGSIPISFTLFGSSRVQYESTIRSIGSNVALSPGYGIDDVIIWNISNSLAAGTSTSVFPAHLYNGPATVRFEVNNASGANVVQLNQNYEPIAADFSSQGSMLLRGPPATGLVSDTVLDIHLPKRHTSYQVVNSGTTTVTYRFYVTARGSTK